MLPDVASAGFACKGDVTAVDIDGEGWVHVSLEGAGVNISNGRICRVNVDIGNIKKESCRAMVSVLTTALLSQKPTELFLNVNQCSPPAWSHLDSSSYGFYFLRMSRN